MAEPLKFMFTDAKLQEVARIMGKHYKAFPTKDFLANFKTSTWKNAELKARVKLIAEALHASLPASYSKAIDILIPASQEMHWGYFSIFFPEFVSMYGLEHWDDSMRALEEFTQTSSAEFAIRFFIVKDEKRAMKQMLKWSKSKNHHIRRLASEGCRPRLPWGMKLQSFVENPESILPILENLKADPELYVRKSVANNLNDISKDNPHIALAIAKSWLGNNEDTDWIVNHAMRGLLKSGNIDALKLFGHHDSKGFEIHGLHISPTKINLGDVVQFHFQISNTTKKTLACRLEYAVDYFKSNGKHSRKIFQITKRELDPGPHSFKRSQRFQDLTTRKHYSGKHHIAIVVNGVELAKGEFVLMG